MLRSFLVVLLLIVPVSALLAGTGFSETMFGDGNHEFVCYTRIHRNFYLVIFFASLFLALVVFRLYRLRARHARGLEEKNSIIEEQQKDIMSSIRYAKRIQHAQLPSADLLRQILPESFFFLRPRDIVSGDFYFVLQCEETIYIVAADCTGHGVPGAFLSFIGNSALHRAIADLRISNPSEILDEVNRDVKRMLGQQREGNELDDGMEMAVCAWNPKSRTLAYAGAGISLYLVKNKQLEEIKAVKCSVGSVQSHISSAPSAHEFQLAPGDKFYLGSDGLADQFGGPDGKKLKAAGLRQLIVKLSSMGFADQEKELENFISSWKGSNEQTDDMMLIGIG